MNEKYNFIFLVPFYERDVQRLHDTLDSIYHYVNGRAKIIAINDCKSRSHIGLEEKWAGRLDIIELIPVGASRWPVNTYGSLFCKKYQGVEFAVKNYSFKYLIFLDTDALLTGPKLFEHLEQYYELHSEDANIGILGSFKERADLKKRTRWQWALYILYLVYIKQVIHTDSVLWGTWWPKAKRNGYKLGSHILGGAYIMTYACSRAIITLYPYELLLQDGFHLLTVGDDVLFSMAAFASNFTIRDYGRFEDPLAIALRTLPVSKEEIVSQKKQLIHSVKQGKNGESEEELRAYFKALRR